MENPIVTVEMVKNPDELLSLENAFLKAVGENELCGESARRLAEAAAAEKIVFFAAKQHGQLIGMCSVSPCFSTYACKPCGVFDDFFIRPEHRGCGAARKLVDAAREWCISRGYGGLTVGCAPHDVPMYRSLGFDAELGVMLANNF